MEFLNWGRPSCRISRQQNRPLEKKENILAIQVDAGSNILAHQKVLQTLRVFKSILIVKACSRCSIKLHKYFISFLKTFAILDYPVQSLWMKKAYQLSNRKLNSQLLFADQIRHNVKAQRRYNFIQQLKENNFWQHSVQ